MLLTDGETELGRFLERVAALIASRLAPIAALTGIGDLKDLQGGKGINERITVDDLDVVVEQHKHVAAGLAGGGEGHLLVVIIEQPLQIFDSPLSQHGAEGSGSAINEKKREAVFTEYTDAVTFLNAKKVDSPGKYFRNLKCFLTSTTGQKKRL